MMGDWTDKNDDLNFNPESEQTGLFGFIKGKSSFGFKDDGTAFIGLPGAGRLDFNGNKSVRQFIVEEENENKKEQEKQSKLIADLLYNDIQQSLGNLKNVIISGEIYK